MAEYDVGWCRTHRWGDHGYAGYLAWQIQDACDRTMAAWCPEHNFGSDYDEDIRLKCSDFGSARRRSPRGSKNTDQTFPFLEVKSCAYPTDDPDQAENCVESLRQVQERVSLDLNIPCHAQVSVFAAGPTAMTSLSFICQGRATKKQIEAYQTPPEQLVCEEPEQLVCGP